MTRYKIHLGDCAEILKTFPPQSINTCVTSPPYFGLRDYGVDGQIGLEETPGEYVSKLVAVFREVKRVLRDDGTLWVNLGDSYSGSGKGGQSEEKRSENWQPTYKNKGMTYGLKPKDLIGIPWMVAFALRDDGWYLRSDIIWSKPNPMPESVTDRPTKAHEYIFLLSKSQHYYYDNEAIKEPAQNWGVRDRTNFRGGTADKKLKHSGFKNCNQEETGRNKRTVWTITTKPYKEAHFATYPPNLILPCILAGCPEGGTVLDPFNGSATTGQVALQNNRNYIGIELNPDYIELSERRLAMVTCQPSLFEEATE